MKFTFEIRLDNEVLSESGKRCNYAELSRMVTDLAQDIGANHSLSHMFCDKKGNVIGKAVIRSNYDNDPILAE